MGAGDDAGGTEIGASDEALMLAYARGSRVAFNTLYARHADAVYRYFCGSTYSTDLAADLSQDVWLSLAKSRERYAANADFRHYLFRIAHNRLVSHWRAQRPQVSLDDAAPQLVADDNPQREAEERGVRMALSEAVRRLPAEQRQVLLLRLDGELSLEQIADVQGANYEAVKTRYRLAVSKLRQWIDP